MTDGYDLWMVEIPGRYLDGVAYLDIETRKVPTREGFRMKTGEPLGRRWSAYLAGVAWAGTIALVERTGSEPMFLSAVREALGNADTVVYRATRRFDEMILKGRYTYARRGPEDVPFYPAMPDAEELTWDCRSPLTRPESRRDDIRSEAAAGEPDADLLLIHNLRDVVELVLAYGEPDERCEAWCRRVLDDLPYAYEVLFGDEPED